LHRSVATKDWDEARRVAELWIEWGQTTQPASKLDRLKTSTNVTVQDAVDFFFEFSAESATRGRNTTRKYKNILHGRLLPWCKAEGIQFINLFDGAVIVKKFYASWRKKQWTGRGGVKQLDEPLAIRTKISELERYRGFLSFCLG